MALASNYNFWTVAGLIYALAGAGLFCNATFLSPAPTRNTASGAVSEADTLKRLSAQWLDSRVGAALIVIGFFLQATGSVGTATLNKPAVFVLLGLALFVGYYAFSRDLLVDELASRSSEAATDTPPAASDGKAAPASSPNPDVSPVVVELRQSESAA